jgi:transposase InsO family protein
MVCQLRGAHPRWGPRRLQFELGKAGVSPVPSRSTVYRVLVRRGLVPARKRKRRRQDYKRWQREAPMQLWQLDITGSVFLADGTELKLISGIDDHSPVLRHRHRRPPCHCQGGLPRVHHRDARLRDT